MSSIVKLERKYDKVSLVENGTSISFIFEPKTEIIYVIVPKDFDDAKQEIESISKRCRVLENDPEHDVNDCIPFDRFKASVDACKSLNPDYKSQTDKCVYQCTVAVKHIIHVGTVETAKQYTSILSEKRFFEAFMGHFEHLKRSDLQRIKDLEMVSDDIEDVKLYSFNECVNPTPVQHPGLLTEIPNSWTDVAETGRVEESSSSPIAPVVKPAPLQKQPSQRTTGTSPFLRLTDTSNNDKEKIDVKNPDKDTTITIQNSSTLVSRDYNFEQSLHSMTLDIISVYLKGQKMLYIEAKVYCEQHLYALMLPAIIITALCSVISVSLNSYSFGGIIVSCFTACNSCILSLVTYLKLDAKAEAHKMTAYSFEKLQSMCEFSSGRILFADKQLTLLKLMEEIGTNVKDIKEKNQFILPEAIRYRFPYLYSTNVFAEVKQIQNTELILINEMQNLMEEGRILKKDIDMGNVTDVSRYEEILREQNIAFKELINFRKQYMEIDNKFKNEIEKNIKWTNEGRFNCCQWLKN